MLSAKMHVVKRSGEKAGVRFDAITDRNEILCSAAYGCELTNIDAPAITQEVVRRFENGMTTHRLDMLTVKVCSEQSIGHPEYADLAARIIVSDLQKTTVPSFLGTVERLAAARDARGRSTSRLSDEFVGIARRAAKAIDRRLAHARDFGFRYFGIMTMLRSYLFREGDEQSPVIERPQHTYMRVSLAIHCSTPSGDGHLAPEVLFSSRLELAFQTYALLSEHKITHPSPLLFNAGTSFQQFASCFLLSVDDDLDTILEAGTDANKCGKRAGASGICLTPMRPKGALVRSTGGASSGVTTFNQYLEKGQAYVNQGGRRPGVIAPYLEVWHDDVLDFIAQGRIHGVVENAPQLKYGLWVPDLFMEAVIDELAATKAGGGSLPEGSVAGDWWLFNPEDVPGLYLLYGEAFAAAYRLAVARGLYRRKVKASEIMHAWFITVAQRGNPYILFKDHINRKSNLSHYRTITNSNVCVPAETLLLTDKGHLPIGDLADQAVRVWNGEVWSTVTVRKTGADQPLVRVALDNTASLDCTPAHKFYDAAGGVVRAGVLRPGVCLEKTPSWPVIRGGEVFPHAYTHGLFTADGHYSRGVEAIHLYGDKQAILDDPRFEEHSQEPWLSVSEAQDRMTVRLIDGLRPKFEVPLQACLEDKIRWFEGYCDGDGCVVRKGTSYSIQVCSVDPEFLRRVRLALQTLGCDPKITPGHPARTATIKGAEYECQATWRLLVNTVDLWTLIDLGFAPHRLKFDGAARPNRDARRFVRVTGVEVLATKKDTYCFTEPLRGRGVFNGILTGNCAEVTLPARNEEGKRGEAEYGVCFLGAIPLASHVVPDVRSTNPGKVRIDWEGLMAAVSVLAVNIDKKIDINWYPAPPCERSSLTHRAIGIGTMGLADVFALHRFPFGSPEAIVLDEAIHAAIYFAAMRTSSRRAREVSEGGGDGRAPGNFLSFEGCAAQRGLLQPDLWVAAGHLALGWEDRLAASTGGALTPDMWAGLRADCQTHLRNGYVTACMPTATSSNAIGQNECFEPFTSNLYTRKTLAGEFVLVNRHLVADLELAGIWSSEMGQALVARKGSVQALSAAEAADDPRTAASIGLISEEVRRLYRTAREMDQRLLTLHAASRNPYLSQSQSLNYYFGAPNLKKILSVIVLGYQKGLTTGSYYIHTQAATSGGRRPDIDPPRFEQSPARPEEAATPPAASAPKRSQRTWVCTEDSGCTACDV